MEKHTNGAWRPAPRVTEAAFVCLQCSAQCSAVQCAVSSAAFLSSVRSSVHQTFLFTTLQIAGQDVPCTNLQSRSNCWPSSIINLLTRSLLLQTQGWKSCTQGHCWPTRATSGSAGSSRPPWPPSPTGPGGRRRWRSWCGGPTPGWRTTRWTSSSSRALSTSSTRSPSITSAFHTGLQSPAMNLCTPDHPQGLPGGQVAPPRSARAPAPPHAGEPTCWTSRSTT